MNQHDLNALAHQFIVNAINAQAEQNICIEYCGEDAKLLANICAEKVKEIGASPYMFNSSAEHINATIGNMTEEEVNQWEHDCIEKLKTTQGFLRIRDDEDVAKLNLKDDVKKWYQKANRNYINYRVDNTNWLLVTAPTKSFAKKCNMKLNEFEEFYKQACLVNYIEMRNAAEPLVDLMAKGKKVHIYSPEQETDLKFSIEGIGSVSCVGNRNMPDGEVYTAPVKNSVNGTIKFSKTNFDGKKFEFIKLEIKDGRIDKAEAENSERTKELNTILDADEGARYFGEFAINFNPYILNPTGSILFDEKISGGIHLAAGECYEEASNGNTSVNHWDMVHIQRPEYGGGEIWIDNRLIRKDGIFVIDELKNLNPEELIEASKIILSPT